MKRKKLIQPAGRICKDGVGARTLPFFDIDFCPLRSVEDFYDWREIDFREFDYFLHSYLKSQVFPVYRRVEANLRKGENVLPLSAAEQFAVAAWHGVPVEVNMDKTRWNRGILSLKTKVPVHFFMEDGILKVRSFSKAPQKGLHS
jgi:hypothetical protein